MADLSSKDDLAFALDTIRREIQSWLDWQASERRREGIETTDDTHLMRVPVWPTRGVLKNWVAALERAHGAVETSVQRCGCLSESHCIAKDGPAPAWIACRRAVKTPCFDPRTGIEKAPQ